MGLFLFLVLVGVVLAAPLIQGAAIAWIATQLAGHSPTLWHLAAGALGIPTLQWWLRKHAPRIGMLLGAALCLLWASACGLDAYRDPTVHGWPTLFIAIILGTLGGALANLPHPFALFLALGNLLGEDADPRAVPSPRGAGARSAASRAQGPRSQRREPTPENGSAWDAWRTLGVEPGASREDIRRAYRARMKEYHPDRVQTLGPEIRELAERKVKEISIAYGELSRP